MSGQLAPERQTDSVLNQLLAGRYQIETKLGEGAMGAVYRAHHVKFGRPFAVKVLHKRLLEDKKIAQRFEREAELAGRLHHPNVIGVVDVGETPDGLRYMVMDFAEGSDLAELLSEAPMPPARIIHLVRQMLEGLYHAHEAGLIHRDFKPENVIVERNDHGTEVPRIVDFGISILREGGESTDSAGRLTTNGLVLGTPHYMAPEQAVADPIDHRIDLFAMGIVVYEMLCGMLPFDGNGAEVARANLLLDPPPISKRVPYLEVDPLLEAFARLLMSKKRDHRPATAKAARELLDLIERDRGAAAAALGLPAGTGTRPQQLTQPVDPQRPTDAAEASAVPRTASAVTGVDGVAATVQAKRIPSPVPASASAAVPRPSDLEAPPLQLAHAPSVAVAAATGALAPPKPHPATTSLTDPLPWSGDDAPPRSSRRWVFLGGGLVAVGAIVTIIFAMRGGGDGGGSKPAEPKVAMAGSGAEQQPTPPQTPPQQPEVKRPEVTPIDPQPEVKQTDPQPEVKQTDPTGSGGAPITDPPPTKIDHVAGKPRPPKGNPASKLGKPDPTKKDPAKQDPAGSAVTKTDPTKSDPSKQDPTKPPSPTPAEALVAAFGAAKAELNALRKSHGNAAADNIDNRLRLVQIAPAMADPGKIPATAAEVAAIRQMIAAARAKKP